MVNPFPLSRHRSGGRAHAHHNPMEPFAGQRSGRYRPKLVSRAPRCIPDERFDQLFAQLGSHRDRALVRCGSSTGRGLGIVGCHGGRCRPWTAADHGDPQWNSRVADVAGRTGCVRVVTAVSGASWPVWCRPGGDEPLWWTLRRPFFGRCVMTRHGRCLPPEIQRRVGVELVVHDLRHYQRRIGWLETRRCR